MMERFVVCLHPHAPNNANMADETRNSGVGSDVEVAAVDEAMWMSLEEGARLSYLFCSTLLFMMKTRPHGHSNLPSRPVLVRPLLPRSHDCTLT